MRVDCVSKHLYFQILKVSFLTSLLSMSCDLSLKSEVDLYDLKLSSVAFDSSVAWGPPGASICPKRRSLKNTEA